MGIGVVLVGDLLVATILALTGGAGMGADGGLLSGLGAAIAGVVLLMAIGATLFGGPVAVLTVPSGVVWVLVVRHLARDGVANQGGEAPNAAPTATNSGWAESISTSHDASRSSPDGVANV